jgi:hypothetical protein
MRLAVSGTGHRCQPVQAIPGVSPSEGTSTPSLTGRVATFRAWARAGIHPAGTWPSPPHVPAALPEACTPGHPCLYSIPACAACLAPATGERRHTPPCCELRWRHCAPHTPLAPARRLPSPAAPPAARAGATTAGRRHRRPARRPAPAPPWPIPSASTSRVPGSNATKTYGEAQCQGETFPTKHLVAKNADSVFSRICEPCSLPLRHPFQESCRTRPSNGSIEAHDRVQSHWQSRLPTSN